MVSRFRRLSNYPNKFNRTIADDQSAVPSQFSPVPPPFDPSLRPDMLPTPPPDQPILSIVRAAYDSRFPNTFDFYFQDVFDGGTSLTGGYQVPSGYVLVLRQLTVTVYGKDGEVVDPMVDVFGFTIDSHSLQILIDGVSTPNWTPDTQGFGGVPIFDLFSGVLDIELFCIIDQNSLLTIQIPGVTNLATSHQFEVVVHYYGNLILASGRSSNSEIGNSDPLLVTTNVNEMG